MKGRLASTIFGKEIHSLTRDDLIKYFNSEQRETDTVEFKAYIDEEKPNTTKESRDNEKIDSILKSVCAFLNSDGGILIWGAPKGKKGHTGKEAIYQGSLTPVKVTIEPDQFTNKISSLISPLPSSILFQPISLEENTFCYVIEINRSEFSPHQYKGTYYMRLDGSTRTAPHHFVEALMKKISYPKLRCSVGFGKIINFPNLVCVPIIVQVENLSEFLPEKNVKYQLISRGINIVSDQALGLPQLDDLSNLTRQPTELLVHRMPVYEYYILVRPRLLHDDKTHAHLMVITWGELSPPLTCTYDINFFRERTGSVNHYDSKIARDNEYLMDITPEDTNANTTWTEALLEQHTAELQRKPIFQSLHLFRG